MLLTLGVSGKSYKDRKKERIGELLPSSGTIEIKYKKKNKMKKNLNINISSFVFGSLATL